MPEQLPRDPDLTAEAESLAKLAAEAAPEAERERRLSPEVIDAVLAAGFARHFVPVAHGGAAGGFLEVTRAVATVAEGCASAAWCASLTASLGRMAAYLPASGQAEVWRQGPDTLIVGGLMPAGRARRTPGGWRLSGSWPYVSLVDASSWALLCALTEDEDATPHYFAVPRAAYTVRDTWRSVGMRATGSNTLVVDGAQVPDDLAFPRALLEQGTAPDADADCHRAPLRSVNGLTFAAPVIGTARGALRVWTAETARRAASDTEARTLARTSGELDAATMLLERAAETADAGHTSPYDIVRATRDCSLAAGMAADAVTRLLRASGTGALQESAPLQRYWRDVTAAASHLVLRFDNAATGYARHLWGDGR